MHRTMATKNPLTFQFQLTPEQREWLRANTNRHLPAAVVVRLALDAYIKAQQEAGK